MARPSCTLALMFALSLAVSTQGLRLNHKGVEVGLRRVHHEEGRALEVEEEEREEEYAEEHDMPSVQALAAADQATCCCKMVKESECVSPRATFTYTANDTDVVPGVTKGLCCLTRKNGCDWFRSFRIDAENAFKDASAEAQTRLGSGQAMCMDDRVWMHKCMGHEDCPGTQACALQNAGGEPLARKCVNYKAADMTCGGVVDGLSWVLLTTSSGGGGHLAAARGLMNRINLKMKEKIDAMEQECPDSPSVWQAKAWLVRDEASLDGYSHINGYVATMDVMMGPCTEIFGLFSTGSQMASAWNDAMREEKFSLLQRLASLSNVNERLIPQFTFCRSGIERLVRDIANTKFNTRFPGNFVDTQPFYKSILADVAKVYGVNSYDVHITDFPGEKCVAFAGTLNRLSWEKGWGSKHVRLHTPGASMDNLKKWFGFEVDSQYIIEDNLPLDDRYRDTSLALPGESVTITWKKQVSFSSNDELVDEGEFYKFMDGIPRDGLFDFDVKAEDRVGLIMLGSEPGADTVVKMVKLMTRLGLYRAGKQDGEFRSSLPSYADTPNFGTSYLFVACGRKSSQGGPGGLYDRVRRSIMQYEEEASALPNPEQRIRIVPFSGQFAIKAYARSDVAVVKVGGLTAAEALQLTKLDQNERLSARSTRAGQKRILVNSWSSSYALGKKVRNLKEPDSISQEDWQQSLIDLAQVGWEGGNAEYLAEKIQAQMVCVTPSKGQLERGGSSTAFASDPQWKTFCDLPFIKDMDASLFGERVPAPSMRPL